jgi:hypothetical protein
MFQDMILEALGFALAVAVSIAIAFAAGFLPLTVSTVSIDDSMPTPVILSPKEHKAATKLFGPDGPPMESNGSKEAKPSNG